jgi:hypothetical protein
MFDEPALMARIALADRGMGIETPDEVINQCIDPPLKIP